MVRNALTMMVGTLFSRVLGLLREVITAALFGASAALDSFFVAFTLSNLARQLLAEGALSAAFVPVFTRVLERDGRERAERLARQASAVLMVAGLVVVVVGVIASPLLVRIMAPGFGADRFDLAVSLTRRLFPFLLLVSMAALAMGALNSLGRFFVPALAPALSNLVFIGMALALARSWGVDSLVWAVLAGGLCQMVLQIWWLRRAEDMSLLPARPERGDGDLAAMMKLFLPYALGLSLNQLNPVLTRVFGSYLPDGSISVLNYANRIVQLPLGLVVIAISQAVLPELARSSDDESFCRTLTDALRFGLFLVLPVTLGALLLSSESVHLIFVRGAFGAQAWHETAGALFWSMVGLPGMACGTVIMRGLYARSRPREAMATAAGCVVVLLAGGLLFTWSMGVNGVALAGSLAFTASSLMGYWLLRRQVTGLNGLFPVRWLLPQLATLAALAVTVCAWKLILPYDPSWGLILRAGWLVVVAFCGAVAWGVTGRLVRCEEWTMIGSAMGRQGREEP